MKWPFSKRKTKKAPRMSRGYAGAAYNRLVTDWIAQGTSIDSEVKGSLRPLRNRSRQLARDNDYIKGFLREVQNNVIGEGIPFQSQVKMQRGGKLNDAVNNAIEDAFDTWSKKENCHVAGTLSFQELERMVIRSVAESGEVFIRLIYQKFGKSKIPLGLELIESDLLDDNYSGLTPAGNEVRMGVELDTWGRPQGYWFFQRHPGDYQFPGVKNTAAQSRIRIPADEVIHIAMFERPGQTRGVPWIASSMMRLHHMGGLEEAEVISARATASLMGFIESAEGELQGDDVQANERVTDFQPGVFKYLAKGERVTVPDLHRSGGSFEPFMKAMLKGVAAGIGTSYATVSRDYSESNFSSSRMDLLNERDNWRVLQKWVIRNFHSRVFEAWLDMAVLSGALALPGYELQVERYQKVRWMPRGWAWIDPVKEVTASKEALLGGLTTLTSELAQQGEDVEEVFAQRARERELAKSYGLTFDTDFANDAQKAPKQGPQPNNELKPVQSADPAA